MGITSHLHVTNKVLILKLQQQKIY